MFEIIFQFLLYNLYRCLCKSISWFC